MALLKYVRYINKHKETWSFRQIKIRHFYFAIWRLFRQIFRPYGIFHSSYCRGGASAIVVQES